MNFVKTNAPDNLLPMIVHCKDCGDCSGCDWDSGDDNSSKGDHQNSGQEKSTNG